MPIMLFLYLANMIDLNAGIVFFLVGNCLNFISFGYAAQVIYVAHVDGSVWS